jgi:phosphoglycerate dehydrogenase-like enzyme
MAVSQSSDHPMTRSPDQPIRKLLIATHHRLDLWVAPEWFAERLRKDFPQFDVVRLAKPDGIDRELADTEITFTSFLQPEHFRLAHKLRWIHSPAAAVHQFLFPELVNSDVILTNAREVHGTVVAEQVIAMIFAVAKRIPQAVRFQQQRLWGQEAIWEQSGGPREIAGTTLGMVGLGSIGRNVARHAAALGMRVIVVRQNADAARPESVHEILPPSKINQMFAAADYIVLAVPVTPATRHMIGREQFAKMKSDAVLINVGRGSLIDETALLEVLQQRKIGGAALDVFEQEPLPPDSPLWNMDNLLITPHTAGMTAKLWERHYTLFSENVRRYLSGQPLLALVDKKSGY